MNYSKIKQVYVDAIILNPFPLSTNYKYIPCYCNILITMLSFCLDKKKPKIYANDSNYVWNKHMPTVCSLWFHWDTCEESSGFSMNLQWCTTHQKFDYIFQSCSAYVFIFLVFLRKFCLRQIMVRNNSLGIIYSLGLINDWFWWVFKDCGFYLG